MKPAAALGFLLALGIWVGHALAALPGPTQLPTTTLPLTTAIPTLPKLPTTTTLPALPTTSVPKLPTTTTTPTLPKTTTPKLPTTTTSAAPVVTTASTATGGSSTPSVSSAVGGAGSVGSAALAGGGSSTSGAGGSGAGSSGASSGPDGGASGSSGGQASSQGAGLQRLESSRPYLATKGPKSKRRIILSFVLSNGGRVYFVVKQVAPACRLAGRFSVKGRQGVNRVPFTGRVGGKPLSPGTYLISATTRQSTSVLRVTLVVVERGRPTRAALRAARAANVCPPSTVLTAAPGFAESFGTLGFTPPTKQGVDTPLPGSGAGKDSTSKSASEVLGAAIERAAAEAIKPLAVTLLGMAILLLGLAALPKAAVPDPRLNDLLVRHRPEIAAAGAAAMVTGILYFLIS